MVRGLFAGMVWGAVVAVAGLAVISQIAPLPQQISPEPPAAPETTAPPMADAPVLAEPPAPAPSDMAPDAAPVPPDAPAAAMEPTTGDALARQPEPTAQAPELADAKAPDAPRAPADPGPSPAPDVQADAAPAITTPPAVRDVPAADSAPVPAEPPPLPPLTPQEEALLAPMPPAEPAPQAEPVPDPADGPGPVLPQVGDGSQGGMTPPPVTGAADAPADLPGDAAAVMPTTDPAVESDRLPRIGSDDPLPDVVVIPEVEADARPLAAFARPFENPEGKPLFAILLVDDGRAETDRAGLARLPFPVTFVVDPLAEGAADAASIYRSGMQEVVFVATGLPAGATPADAEQTFQSHAMTLPETVGVIDLPEGGFQDDRALAAAILPILTDQGRGLLTYDRGLNAADQIARREGLPAATIFRRLDAEGESIPTIRRYLDRAAFRAAQEGSVAVIGTTAPDTVAAILEWTVEGRAASVALAPVSALLLRP